MNSSYGIKTTAKQQYTMQAITALCRFFFYIVAWLLTVIRGNRLINDKKAAALTAMCRQICQKI